MKRKISSHGVVPVLAILIVAIIAGLVGEGVYFAFFINDIQTYKRAARETEIAFSINKMELLKRSLDQSLLFSFRQSLYDISQRGGYSDLSQTDSLNCVPYWIYYSDRNIPDYKTELETNTLKLFNKYAAEISKQKAFIPKFTDVKYDSQSSVLEISSISKMSISEEDFFELRETSKFSRKIEGQPLMIYEKGKEAANKVSDIISSASSYDDAVSDLSNLQLDGVEIIPSENLASSGSKFAIRVLVRVSDDDSHLFYDFTEDSLSNRNVKLPFYVLGGTEQVEKLKDQCQIEQY